MTSSGHVMSSAMSPISGSPLSYRFPILTNLLSPVVSEIASKTGTHPTYPSNATQVQEYTLNIA